MCMTCPMSQHKRGTMSFGYRDVSPLVWFLVAIVVIVLIFFVAKWLIDKNNDKPGWTEVDKLQAHDLISTPFYDNILAIVKQSLGMTELTADDQILFDQVYMAKAHSYIQCLVEKLSNKYGPSYTLSQLGFTRAERDPGFNTFMDTSTQECQFDPNKIAADIVTDFNARNVTPEPAPVEGFRGRRRVGLPSRVGARRGCCGQ